MSASQPYPDAIAIDALSSPVVVDGRLSDEKLAELLALQTEYPELDYKATVDVTTTEGKVKLAKFVDNNGALTGQLDGADLRAFDEANLVPSLLKWLSEPLELRTRVAEREGHSVVAIYVGRDPSGCAFVRAHHGCTDCGTRP